MSVSKISGVKISGIASAVPEQIRTIFDDMKVFGEDEVYKISANIGVKSRYIAPPHLCTSDLCFFAAERLLHEASWKKDSVDALIFVSQTPDYRLPATSCILQKRLGLSNECASFDISMGCSGYIYGLWVASSLIVGGNIDRVLLLVGDTSNKLLSPQDRSVALLFGDAGTATLLEKSAHAQPMTFVMGTDGDGANNLIVPSGGFRKIANESTKIRTERENNNIRSDEDLFMNGAEIFSFTLERLSPLIRSVLDESSWTVDDVDFFIFHQANKFILNFLTKKMKLSPHKVPIVLEKFGNTSSASIPLALSSSLHEELCNKELRLIFSGFGVGYSWGAVALNVGPIIMPDIVFVP
ncbi:MAG: 3-oxoacyl-[acyl-carrier-protein] synthase-3 [Candidatus Electronema aureum]|uniref:3-oxoacyl-[acyl-carrier-protein] synthase-3 n=1 Tax=Candidatus Electronema aureum TaxID=2005002 RepID=A0A521FZS6_9BACT|nr:MAG: 3-oxoacyl-[acyl-carrier-protein] synthase-3 [Candidatus Electronema aureum]